MDSINSFATGGLGDIVSFIGSFLVLLVIAVALFLFALRAGRATFASLILALYAGFGLYTIFPYKDLLGAGGTPLVATASGLLIFGILTFVPYMLLRRVITGGHTRIDPITLVVLSLVTAGFILALAYNFFNLESVLPLSGSLKALVEPDSYLFWWFAAPLAGIFFATR